MKKILLLILLVLPVTSQAYTYEQFNTAYTADYLATVDIKDDLEWLKANTYLQATLEAYRTANLGSVQKKTIEIFCGFTGAEMTPDGFYEIIKKYMTEYPSLASHPFSVNSYFALKVEFSC